MCDHRHPLHCILPPHVVEHMAGSDDPKIRKLAFECIAADSEARAVRSTMAMLPVMAAIPSPSARKYRLVYDMRNRRSGLPGRLVRAEGDKATKDPAVNEAYNGAGATYDFYQKLFCRNSLDDNGMSLISSVHFGLSYNNAFWNGEQMAYGDGDGTIFVRFTKAIDVIGHELTHGVIAHTANLEYLDQPGALNEHFADVFGSLIKQWKKNQTARQADWLIGDAIMGPGVEATAIRTMKGEKAYEDDPVLGSDPQPKHMQSFYRGSADSGGVHINSGIPNHAFFLAACAMGGKAWTRAGAIWYATLRKLTRFSQFQEAADTTYEVATNKHGASSKERKAVKAAWKAVGINV